MTSWAGNECASTWCANAWAETLTRALTAQAWAVACAIQATWKPGWGDTAGRYEARAEIAALPAPADLAAELLR